MTDIDPRTNITREIREAIAGQGVPMLDVMIGHATGFKEMKSTGTGPIHGTALRETLKLMAELQMRGLLWFYTQEGSWAKSA